MAEIASQDCCFPPIRRAKFAKDVRHMKFDGSHANEEGQPANPDPSLPAASAITDPTPAPVRRR